MNNNNLDFLFKLVIPAIFMIIWVVSQIANREVSSAPKRATPGNRLGPRPGNPWSVASQPDVQSTPPVASVPRKTADTRLQKRQEGMDSAGVVMIDRRVRNAPAAQIVSEPTSSKRASNKMVRSSQTRPTQPGSTSPSFKNSLTTAASGALASVTDSAAMVMPIRTGDSLESIKTALSSPERIQEAILLQVVLGPPVSRKNRR